MSDTNDIMSATDELEFLEEPVEPWAPPANIGAITRLKALIKGLRPKQWVKNVLVISAPLAALGSGVHVPPGLRSWQPLGFAFICFCLASSMIYLINDAFDVASDRQHPVKKYRPIASGLLPVSWAYVMAVILGLSALGLASLVNRPLLVTIAAYIGIQLAYCWGLKNQAVIDIAIVSSGFLLRAIAGGVSVNLPLSRWFLLVMAFGSLFMAAGKRYAELHLAEQTGAKIRKSLRYYTTSYLRFVWSLAATALVIFYGLWALDTGKANNIFYAISIIPFTIAVLRYAIDIDGALAGAPEEIALHDRVLQALAVLWIVAIGVAIIGP